VSVNLIPLLINIYISNSEFSGHSIKIDYEEKIKKSFDQKLQNWLSPNYIWIINDHWVVKYKLYIYESSMIIEWSSTSYIYTVYMNHQWSLSGQVQVLYIWIINDHWMVKYKFYIYESSMIIEWSSTSYIYMNHQWSLSGQVQVLTHLTQRVMWPIAITWCLYLWDKIFKKSSLKPLCQFKKKLARVVLMGDWMLFNNKWTSFQPYHGENMLLFDEMVMVSVLYYTNMLS
jgi:hypothetical protein